MSVLLRRYYQLLVNRNWLTSMTLQAIISAFGDDGMAVIEATNAYLIDIAKTDRSKARKVANAINNIPVVAEYIYLYGDSFGRLIYNLGIDFNLPKFPKSGVSDEYRMWMYMRSTPTGWNTIEGILSHTDWVNSKSGHVSASFSNIEVGTTRISSPYTIVKFFVPQTLPSGYSYARMDAGHVYINSTLITTSNFDGNYDFTGKIILNRVNFVVISCSGIGTWGTGFGFK